LAESDPGRRVALLLEYDGSPPLAGSQRQRHSPTIQSALEDALRRLTGEGLRVAFAGRTDAGVHALGQVAAFTTGSRLSTKTFVRGLNALLPESIAVRAAVEAPERFDPRRHACARTYRYLIYNAPTRSPLWRSRAWHVAERLDAGAMRAAARALIGEHDFAAFSRREGVSTVRRVQRCQVTSGAEGSNPQLPIVIVEMEANAFLRHQVRRTVGALVQVGRGKLRPTEFRRLLREARPATAGPVAPPHGLYLVRVTYPGLDLDGSMRYDERSALGRAAFDACEP
jgi:tRNA pseudouridine38-40 synthase